MDNNIAKEKLLYFLRELHFEQEVYAKLQQYIDEENYEDSIVLLRKKRISLLEKLHASQKALDDLDLLVYQMKKLEK